jgi:hypothetical protein
MASKEEKVAKKIEEMFEDIELDLNQIGIHLSKVASEDSFFLPRLSLVLDAAQEQLNRKSPKKSKGNLESKARKLVDQAKEGSGKVLTALYSEHAFEDEPCELCEWLISESDDFEWLEPDAWIFEALISNRNCPDSLLSKMMDDFEPAPAAWGIAAEIQHHPNASPETVARADKYSNGPEWDD